MRYRVYLLALLTPSVAAAAAPTNFAEAAQWFLAVLQNGVAILFSLAALGLLYGTIVFLLNGDNESKREEMRPYLFWGIVGIAVLIAMWGLVALLQSSVFGGAFGIPFITPPK